MDIRSLPGGRYMLLLSPFVLFPASSMVLAEDRSRQLEEIVVTAERREASVSDTSISITAFTGDMLEEFGIRNQEDLQNFIPAAVIEPYDMAIRGVGRNFRSLGGDPGVATYFNGVYSEDFGIASTEGGLYDVERIEVLRGPQGTLYGRNAVGGAINFISKKPTDEFEAEAKVLVGDYGLTEMYGLVSGEMIEDWLMARYTAVNRQRDGYVKDLGGFDGDPDDYGDENYAIYLRSTPTDSLEFNLRANERSYRRRMGGATAAGIVNFLEFGGSDTDRFDITRRNTETFAWGYRRVDSSIPCLSTVDRSAGNNCLIAGQPVFTFSDPVTGADVLAQRVTPGVDAAFDEEPNYAFNTDPAKQKMLGLGSIDGNDLKTDTNGQQNEGFDHQAASFDATWDISDGFSVKYIFGYTDYFYDRTSDDDLTSNQLADEQFYVSQETEYVSHEIQAFTDFGDKLTVTSGLFYYVAKITQRGDFYDSTRRGRYVNDFDYSNTGTAFSFIPFFPKVDLFSAKQAGEFFVFGQWAGDTGDNIPHGPNTAGTNLEYQTRSQREAFAAYSQGVYTFNEHFALTLGVRWAKDRLVGEENLFSYDEDIFTGLGTTTIPNADGSILIPSLLDFNVANGAMLADGTIVDPDNVRLSGIPISFSLWRKLKRTDDKVTGRINLDWTPNDDTLIYLSATQGYRSGGFNLVFFSANSQFEPEELISYELGYKGQLLDGRMQLNAALYFYDYDNVHTFGQGPSATGTVSTSVFAVPGAEIRGFDSDVVWLATDRLTLGATVSFTNAEYTKDFDIVDENDSERPSSLFSPFESPININGKQMLRVPKRKASSFAQYSMPLSSGQLDLLTTLAWIDKVYFSPFESERDAAPDYYRWDVRAQWTSPTREWSIALFINNVTNEIGIRQIDRTNEAQNFRRSGATTNPRLYGLEVRYVLGGG